MSRVLCRHPQAENDLGRDGETGQAGDAGAVSCERSHDFLPTAQHVRRRHDRHRDDLLQSVHNINDMFFIRSEVSEHVRLRRRDAGDARGSTRKCNLVRLAVAGYASRIVAKAEVFSLAFKLLKEESNCKLATKSFPQVPEIVPNCEKKSSF